MVSAMIIIVGASTIFAALLAGVLNGGGDHKELIIFLTFVTCLIGWTILIFGIGMAQGEMGAFCE